MAGNHNISLTRISTVYFLADFVFDSERKIFILVVELAAMIIILIYCV